jgi:hypothetical protein
MGAKGGKTMPTQLSKLLGEMRWAEVVTDAATFNVAYYPDAMSLMQQVELQELGEQVQALAATDPRAAAQMIADVTCKVICDWDLVDGDKVIPLTAAAVAAILPEWVFRVIIETVAADRRARQEEKKVLSVTSDAISPPTGKRARSPNGTRISAPQDTWA